ncbi:MAG: ABC transporter ATP-binding protein [Pseudobdellovibrionaceae bacterium]
MIQIENLKFKYTTLDFDILDIPRFTLKKAEKVFLYGPSGCGKTTFLEVLAGIHLPQTGKLQINGTHLSDLSSAERDQFRSDHMGYIFQSFNLIPYLNVEENITLPLYFSPQKRNQVAIDDEQKTAQDLCRFLGIEKYLKSPVTQLSVGQQQRVAAARAIIGKPKLILADEPTSALDFDHREKFIHLLFTLCEQQQTSVLFVSHDRTLEKLFDRSLSLLDINKAAHLKPQEVV